MPSVTAIRSAARGRVRVELDGAAWRTIPLEVAVRVGLRTGLELDRPLLRTLRRELRRDEALSRATGALRGRDLSERGLDSRLRRKGVAPAARAEAIEILARAGFVDDERVVCRQAAGLCERGLGDEAIRVRLEQEGFDPSLVRAAVATLEPEPERARRLVRTHGGGPKTARLLARRGFAEDSVEACVAERP